MKNLNIITYSIVVIIMSSLLTTDLIGQVSNQNRIAFSPFNLANPNGASAQITYSRLTSENNEIQFSYAHRLRYMDPVFLEERDIDNFICLFIPFSSTDARYVGGFRLGIENQFYTKGTNHKVNYFGFELFFEQDKLDFLKENFLWWSKKTNYQLVKNEVGFNIKHGTKFLLRDKIVLDIHYGLGVKYADYSYRNNVDDFDSSFRNEDVGVWKINLPVNIKLAYAF